MDPSGRVRPCVTFDADKAVFGSLRDQPPEAVFGNALADAFAAVTLPQPEVCGTCEHRMFCQSCLVRGLDGSEWIPRESARGCGSLASASGAISSSSTAVLEA
jgi:radical SAM protein with 4Fe4S-binding SPASM domain